jgi:hypothetical protein
MTRDRPNRDSRQTVTAAKKPYPGDDLVPDATMVIDRYLDFDAPRDQVWPWLLQLGKRRAGWYLPRLVELFVPRRHRASRVLLPQFQHLVTGMDVPDWGPGDPVFRVAELEPGRAIVYLSLRERTAGPGGPADGNRGPGVLALSWALFLHDAPGPSASGTRVHIRLRFAPSGTRFRKAFDVGGGFVDWLTIVGLRRGLAERLNSSCGAIIPAAKGFSRTRGSRRALRAGP